MIEGKFLFFYLKVEYQVHKTSCFCLALPGAFKRLLTLHTENMNERKKRKESKVHGRTTSERQTVVMKKTSVVAQEY